MMKEKGWSEVAKRSCGILTMVVLAAACADEPPGQAQATCTTPAEGVHSAILSGLDPSVGKLSPPFSACVFDYEVVLDVAAGEFHLVPHALEGVKITVGSATVATGSATPEIAPALAHQEIVITTSLDKASADYRIAVRRAPLQVSAISGGCGPGGMLGTSVAASGDRIVVGAVGCTLEGVGTAGAAYIYAWSEGQWTLEAMLAAQAPSPYSLFGQVVAIDGDVVVVGEPLSAAGTGQAGRAHVYRRTAGVWSVEKQLTSPVAQPRLLFGNAVGVAGDRVAVGAPATDGTDLANAGAVYVFDRVASVWQPAIELKSAEPQANAGFGHALALGPDRLAVGSPTFDISPALGNAGRVELFAYTVGAWSPSPALELATPRAGDQFGHAVALAGELLAVGAPLRDDGTAGVGAEGTAAVSMQAGSAHLYRWAAGVVTPLETLHAIQPAANTRFGSQIALAKQRVLVGSTQENSGGRGTNPALVAGAAVRSGAAWLFTLDAAGAVDAADVLKASNAESGDFFGAAVACTDSRVVVAAQYEDSSAAGIGAGSDDNDALESGAIFLFE